MPPEESNAVKREDDRIVQQVRTRLVGSGAMLVTGLVVTLLYVGFLADRFAWYTNVTVVAAAAIAVVSAVALTWVSWGMSLKGRAGSRDY